MVAVLSFADHIHGKIIVCQPDCTPQQDGRADGQVVHNELAIVGRRDDLHGPYIS
jgi:hypothetical protein